MTLRKSISVLSTGGTIAMLKTPQGYRPKAGHLEQSMEKIPELKNTDMPHYTVSEFEHPIDSANMTPDDWLRIAEHIVNNYDRYDGFVVLHGTDTMSYTASALSFMLEDLNKPVILTGSQLPLFETRSDARENLINAILIAGRYAIPEVCIYFNNKLFRGNRTIKIDATSFSAFASPNYPALGSIGTDIRIKHDLIRKKTNNTLRLQAMQPVNICTLRIFPGIPQEMLRTIFQLPLDAVILETYGVGNAPEDPIFIQPIQDAVTQGKLVINCSQCLYTKIRMDEYATGSKLLKAGVISAGDMTLDATITKLFYLFNKNMSLGEIKNSFAEDLRGELTMM